jgi:hypothetical protein
MVYSDTKDPYFRDCFKGHVEQVLVSDIFVGFPIAFKKKTTWERNRFWSKLG